MEINVHKFQEAILAGTFEHTAVHVTAAAFKKDGIADALTKVFADVRAAIEKDQLIQADLVVDFPEPTTITVETGIICHLRMLIKSLIFWNRMKLFRYGFI